MTAQSRPVLVGLHPPKKTPPSPWHDEMGVRLSRAMGLSDVSELLSRVEPLYLARTPYVGDPAVWYSLALRVVSAWPGRRLILAGYYVAKAFGVSTRPPAVWRIETVPGSRQAEVATIPLPSRQKHFAHAKAEVAAFMRVALGFDADTAPIVLPASSPTSSYSGLDCDLPLMTFPEVMKALSVSKVTARKLVLSGQLPVCKVGRFAWRFRRSDVRSFIESRLSTW